MVSVLIPTFNAAAFLPKALASVKSQTVSDWEIVVVEDGSRDGAETLVKSFAETVPHNQIVYENLGRNCGVSAARNRLLHLSKGEYIAFLDADDFWQPNHLSNLLDCLSIGHAVACTPIRIVQNMGADNSADYKPASSDVNNPRRGLFRASFVQTSSCVAMPRATVVRVGNFDEAFAIGEDRDYWFRAVQDGHSLGCTTVASCNYLKHSTNSMINTLLVARQTVAFYEKHLYATGIAPLTARRYIASALRTVGRLTRRVDPADARRIFLRAWKAWPPAIDLPLRAFFVGY